MSYRNAITNLIDVVEGSEPTTMYARNKKFRHQGRAVDADSMSDQPNRTRRFIVIPGVSYALGGAMAQANEPGEVTETVTIHIIYGQNQDTHELHTVIREDLDLLVYRLRLVSLFDRDAGTLQRRRVVGSDIQMDETSGGSAVLSISVEHQYRPTF
jgi:hypothetical protein